MTGSLVTGNTALWGKSRPLLHERWWYVKGWMV